MGGRSRTIGACALILGLTLAGCGGDDEGLAGGGGEGSLAALLGVVPASAGDFVYFGSLARVREHGGIEPADDVEGEQRALVEVAEFGWVVAEPFARSAVLIDAAETGFDLTDIDASIGAGQPPDLISVFTGRIEQADVEEALTTFEPFAADVEQGERAGVATFRFGEEGQMDVSRVSPARPVGEAIRAGVRDGTVWWSRSDAVLDAAIDAATGDDEASLADDEGFTRVASVLDGSAAYSASLTDDADAQRFDPVRVLGPGATPEQVAEIEEAFDANGLSRWELAAVGEAFADDGQDLLIVLWHADEAAAEANEAALMALLSEGNTFSTGAPWAEICAAPGAERDGELLRVRCRLDRPGRATSLFATGDLLGWR